MSRSIEDLRPNFTNLAYEFESKFNSMLDCKREGITLLIYCTYRSFEEQAELYRQGRSLYKIEKKAEEIAFEYGGDNLKNILLSVGPQYGKIVTYAAPGQSMHNYGYAFDAVPLKAGKPLWSTKEETWQLFGEVAKKVGVEWAGNWERFKEYPHIQMPNLDWRQLI